MIKFQTHLTRIANKLGIKKVLWQEAVTDSRWRFRLGVSKDTVIQAWGIENAGRNFCDMIVDAGYLCINSPTQVSLFTAALIES